MSHDDHDPGVPEGGTRREGQDSGARLDGVANQGKPVKPLSLEKVKADWDDIAKRMRELNEKINQNVLRNVEKLENVHYQGMKTADAIKQKIEQDWGAFEAGVRDGLENLKRLGQQNTERALQDLEAKKERMQEQARGLEKSYQEWAAKTGKKVNATLSSLSRFGWKLYLTFLVVAIPIVIMIVVLANALK